MLSLISHTIILFSLLFIQGYFSAPYRHTDTLKRSTQCISNLCSIFCYLLLINYILIMHSLISYTIILFSLLLIQGSFKLALS